MGLRIVDELVLKAWQEIDSKGYPDPIGTLKSKMGEIVAKAAALRAIAYEVEEQSAPEAFAKRMKASAAAPRIDRVVGTGTELKKTAPHIERLESVIDKRNAQERATELKRLALVARAEANNAAESASRQIDPSAKRVADHVASLKKAAAAEAERQALAASEQLERLVRAEQPR